MVAWCKRGWCGRCVTSYARSLPFDQESGGGLRKDDVWLLVGFRGGSSISTLEGGRGLQRGSDTGKILWVICSNMQSKTAYHH